MRKNTCIALLTVLLLVAASFAPSVTASEFQLEPTEVTSAAGSVGGGWYILSTAMFDLFSNEIDGLAYSIIPGGGVSNPITLNQRNADFAILYTPNLFEGYEGLHEEYPEPFTDLRGIARLGIVSVLHSWVDDDVGVERLSELAENQTGLDIDTGTRGLAGELHARRMLEEHGIAYDDNRSWGGRVIHSSYSEAKDRLIDGHIDMFLNNDVIRQPLWVELNQAADVTLLQHEEEAVEAMVNNYGYVRTVIPADTYEGQENDILTTAQDTVFATHKDADEDLVYMMTKLIFEEKERLVSAYRQFENIDIESAIPENAPIHPGAKRYYQEQGLLN